MENENVCSQCRIKQAVYSCYSCGPFSILCASCNNNIHLSKSKLNHVRELINLDRIGFGNITDNNMNDLNFNNTEVNGVNMNNAGYNKSYNNTNNYDTSIDFTKSHSYFTNKNNLQSKILIKLILIIITI